MAIFNFNSEPALDGVIQKPYKAFCNWSPTRPIKNAREVTYDVCGHKFSYICGFTFKSSLPAPYFVLHPELGLKLENGIQDRTFRPIFQVVYVPKSRSTYVRNDQGLSGWYLWQHVLADSGEVIKRVMSLADFYAYYGFNVSQFFQSDVFEKYVPIFKRQVIAAYNTTVKDFIQNMGLKIDHDFTKRDCAFFSKCVLDSMEKIDNVLRLNPDDPTKQLARLAYNANSTYTLYGQNVNGNAKASAKHFGKKKPNSPTTAENLTETAFAAHWQAVKDRMFAAQRACYTLEDYCNSALAACDQDERQYEDGTSECTLEDIAQARSDAERALDALSDLRSALHFKD